jgi:hypothetical protein
MLTDVSIAITSFLRHGCLRACLKGIATNLPECQVIIADDSDTDLCADVAWSYNDCIRLPFDSGLTVKRNATVEACKTPYWLCGCDDFDFSTKRVREGIERMVAVLDENPDIDVAGGRVNDRAYEGFLEYVPGNYIRETRLEQVPWLPFHPVDLTVNYFLARTHRIVPWDETIRPIGGEHGDWFLSMKEAGRKVVWVPGVNINTLNLGNGSGVQDPRYSNFRRRAFACGHTQFKNKRNIKDYIGFDGDKS